MTAQPWEHAEALAEHLHDHVGDVRAVVGVGVEVPVGRVVGRVVARRGEAEGGEERRPGLADAGGGHEEGGRPDPALHRHGETPRRILCCERIFIGPAPPGRQSMTLPTKKTPQQPSRDDILAFIARERDTDVFVHKTAMEASGLRVLEPGQRGERGRLR